MTLEQRGDGKKDLDDGATIDGIIRKANGVNPFLADMNHKISVKTWVKFAR